MNTQSDEHSSKPGSSQDPRPKRVLERMSSEQGVDAFLLEPVSHDSSKHGNHDGYRVINKLATVVSSHGMKGVIDSTVLIGDLNISNQSSDAALDVPSDGALGEIRIQDTEGNPSDVVAVAAPSPSSCTHIQNTNTKVLRKIDSAEAVRTCFEDMASRQDVVDPAELSTLQNL